MATYPNLSGEELMRAVLERARDAKVNMVPPAPVVLTSQQADELDGHVNAFGTALVVDLENLGRPQPEPKRFTVRDGIFFGVPVEVEE